MDKSRHIKKEAMLQALENSLGVVTVACKQSSTPRSTYYKWLKEDEHKKTQTISDYFGYNRSLSKSITDLFDDRSYEIMKKRLNKGGAK